MRNKLSFSEYVKTQTFAAIMDKAGGLDGWNNFSGPRREDMLVVVSRSRDSGLDSDSNWETALEMLGGESDTVTVERDSHWGCGYIEHVMVNVKDKAKAKIAFDIHNQLAEYPLLDDNDYFERQSEYFREYAEGAADDLAEALALHFGLKNTRALRSLAIDLNIECQNYAGEDSCINVYNMRKPSAYDITRLKDVLRQMGSNCGATCTQHKVLFKKLVAAVETYQVTESA